METEKQELTREELYYNETHCPSCGRFVGPLTRCPYCQALTQKRLSIRIFKWISALLSTVGLLMLLFYARNVKTQEVQISQLGLLSNFGHVAIKGTVTDSRGLSKWGRLSFNIQQVGQDGTVDTIEVNAYNKIAKEIASLNLVPKNGDVVRVEGRVRAQNDNYSLLINAPRHISIEGRDSNLPLETSEVFSAIVPNIQELEAINKDMLNSVVKVTGSVLRVAHTQYGDNDLLDNSTEDGFSVWIPKYFLKPEDSYKQGDLIEATGVVSEYNNALQIKINKKGSVKVIKSVSAK